MYLLAVRGDILMPSLSRPAPDTDRAQTADPRDGIGSVSDCCGATDRALAMNDVTWGEERIANELLI